MGKSRHSCAFEVNSAHYFYPSQIVLYHVGGVKNLSLPIKLKFFHALVALLKFEELNKLFSESNLHLNRITIIHNIITLQLQKNVLQNVIYLFILAHTL